MGGCCFTPKKTQLLWWYWLLLFSIVGIPMFLAARYIQNAARHGIIEAWEVRCASRIFWLGSCFFVALLFSLLVFLGHNVSRFPGLERYADLFFFGIGFLFWLLVAIGAAKLTGKAQSRYVGAIVVGCCAVLPALAAPAPYLVLGSSAPLNLGFLPLRVMKFLVCMLPAHYWYRFTASPSPKRAWLVLGALAVGTALFWLVSQYGYDTHIFLFHKLWGVQPRSL